MAKKFTSLLCLGLPAVLGAALSALIIALVAMDAAGEADACRTLAQQVERGQLSLDRYMSTRCKAKHLPKELIAGG